jgi:hypothetical protein
MIFYLIESQVASLNITAEPYEEPPSLLVEGCVLFSYYCTALFTAVKKFNTIAPWRWKDNEKSLKKQ